MTNNYRIWWKKQGGTAYCCYRSRVPLIDLLLLPLRLRLKYELLLMAIMRMCLFCIGLIYMSFGWVFGEWWITRVLGGINLGLTRIHELVVHMIVTDWPARSKLRALLILILERNLSNLDWLRCQSICLNLHGLPIYMHSHKVKMTVLIDDLMRVILVDLYLLMSYRLHFRAILNCWLGRPLLSKASLWCLMVTRVQLLVQNVSFLGILYWCQHLWIDELLSILLDVNVWLTSSSCS